MKLSPEAVTFISNAVQTASNIGIDIIIIEDSMVRGIKDDQTVFMLQKENIPSLEFTCLAINRVDVFLSRLEMASTSGSFEFHVEPHSKMDYIANITFKGKGIKIDYKCGNPSIHKTPKNVRFIETECEINCYPELLNTIQKSASAMGSDILSISGNGEKVVVDVSDTNHDTLTYDIPDTEIIKHGTFTYKHKIKTLLPLLKKQKEGKIKIHEKGFISLIINGFNVYVRPNTED